MITDILVQVFLGVSAVVCIIAGICDLMAVIEHWHDKHVNKRRLPNVKVCR